VTAALEKDTKRRGTADTVPEERTQFRSNEVPSIERQARPNRREEKAADRHRGGRLGARAIQRRIISRRHDFNAAFDCGAVNLSVRAGSGVKVGRPPVTSYVYDVGLASLRTGRHRDVPMVRLQSDQGRSALHVITCMDTHAEIIST